MPIDPRIALGVQGPQIESPMNVMAKAMELQGMQRQNALYERQQAELARQQQRQNMLGELLAGNASPEQLMRANFFEEGTKLADFQRAQAAETRAAQEAKLKQAQSNYTQYMQLVSPEADNPNVSQESVFARVDEAAAMGLISPDVAASIKATVPQDPAQIRQKLLVGRRTVLPIEKQIELFSPKLETRDTGGALPTVDVNPLSPTYLQTVREDFKTMTPDAQARLLEERRQFDAGETRKDREAAGGQPNKFDLAYGTKVAQSQADTDIATAAAARRAVTDLENDYRTLDLIDLGQPITGYGAQVKLEFERLKGLFGNNKTAIAKIGDTEFLESLLGSEVFKSIQALGVGAKGLDTPAEREFLREVVAGTKTMNAATLKRMTEIRAKYRAQAIEEYNARVDSGELDRYFESAGIRKQKLPMPKRKEQAPAAEAGVEVNIPGRGVVRFPNQKAADDFKKAAGL